MNNFTKLLLSLSLLGFLAACSGSSSPQGLLDQIPVPEGPVDSAGEQQSPFTGSWTTSCEPENSNGVRGYKGLFTFTDTELTITTTYFSDESCTNQVMEDTMQGTYSLSRDKQYGDNMLTFQTQIAGFDQTLYMRTATLSDDFIVTSLVSSEEDAQDAVANILLSRP